MCRRVEPLSTVGFLANASVSGVARGDSPLLGCGVSPQNLFSRFCSPPQAARRKKEEHWGHPKPRQEASPPAPPKNLLLRDPLHPVPLIVLRCFMNGSDGTVFHRWYGKRRCSPALRTID